MAPPRRPLPRGCGPALSVSISSSSRVVLALVAHCGGSLLSTLERRSRSRHPPALLSSDSPPFADGRYARSRRLISRRRRAGPSLTSTSSLPPTKDLFASRLNTESIPPPRAPL